MASSPRSRMDWIIATSDTPPAPPLTGAEEVLFGIGRKVPMTRIWCAVVTLGFDSVTSWTLQRSGQPARPKRGPGALLTRNRSRYTAPCESAANVFSGRISTQDPSVSLAKGEPPEADY